MGQISTADEDPKCEKSQQQMVSTTRRFNQEGAHRMALMLL